MKLSETMKLRRLPSVSGAGFTTWDKLVLTVKMNRGPIGLVLFLLSFVVRISFSFAHHTEYADAMKELALGFMGVGAAGFFAGKTDNDQQQEEKAHAMIRQRSGAWPIP
jgi:hypothetical protein